VPRMILIGEVVTCWLGKKRRSCQPEGPQDLKTRLWQERAGRSRNELMLPLRRRAFEDLRERPLVALGVAAAVAAVTERQVDEVLSNGRALGLRTLVMGVDGRDDDVHDRCPADCGRVAETRRRLTCIDAPAEVRLEFKMETTGGAGLPVDLSKTERVYQERRRRLDILIKEVRSDCLSHDRRLGGGRRGVLEKCFGRLTGEGSELRD
jgi:hypothetical protein